MFDVKVQSEQSSLVSSRYSLRSQARLEYFKFKKIIDLPKIYFTRFWYLDCQARAGRRGQTRDQTESSSSNATLPETGALYRYAPQ